MSAVGKIAAIEFRAVKGGWYEGVGWAYRSASEGLDGQWRAIAERAAAGPQGRGSPSGVASGPAALDNREAVFPRSLREEAFGDHRRKTERRSLRETAAKIMFGLGGVALCERFIGRGAEDGGGTRWATISVSERGASTKGAVKCNSVWTCPCCAARIAAGRAVEVDRAVKAHMAVGGRVYMATLTVPHYGWESARAMRRGVSAAWQKCQGGRAWIAAKAAAGIVGTIRAMEVTHGTKGWHPHLHVLIFASGEWLANETFGEMLFHRWSAAVQGEGFGKPSKLSYRYEEIKDGAAGAKYITKWGAGAELCMNTVKKAGDDNRTPFQILADYRQHGWYPDLERFREYAIAFKGAPQLTWTRGLKARYGIEEKDDGDMGPPLSVAAVMVDERALYSLHERGLFDAFLGIVESHGGEYAVYWFSVNHLQGAVKQARGGLVGDLLRQRKKRTDIWNQDALFV